MSDQVATPAIFSLAGRWPQFPSFSQPSVSSKTTRLQVPHWKKKTKTNCKTVQKCAHPWVSWIFNGIKWSIICAHPASWALSDDRHGQLHTLRSAASSAFANSSLASWTLQRFIYHGPSKMWPFLAMFFCNMTNNDMYINGVSPDNPLVEPFEWSTSASLQTWPAIQRWMWFWSIRLPDLFAVLSRSSFHEAGNPQQPFRSGEKAHSFAQFGLSLLNSILWVDHI